jgi:hypothetical protein
VAFRDVEYVPNQVVYLVVPVEIPLMYEYALDAYVLAYLIAAIRVVWLAAEQPVKVARLLTAEGATKWSTASVPVSEVANALSSVA